MKKNLLALCLFVFCAFTVFSSPASVQAANRRTAVRCLNLAKNYLSSNDLENASSQIELGLSYDPSIADLWYMKAAAANLSGEPRVSVIALVTKAMTEGEWVDYNRDGARILYADMLCDTGKYDQALAVLDMNPMIYSSDAEFIRAKAYYRLGTETSVSRAREKINSARKIYTYDLRFPTLFFRYEHLLSKRGGFSSSEVSDALVQKIADSFIAKMPEYENPDAELEVYAAMFASGERQKRLLQAFSSHEMRHPLYAALALENGLMSEQEAWDYFTSFADQKISLELLEDFLPRVTDADTVESVREHLDAFSGLLTVDTNMDGEPELFVKYLRGRPESFYWDSDNDGVIEWSVKCDFGVPETVELTEGNVLLSYGTYPAVVQAVYKSEKHERGAALFNLLDETMRWSPVEMKSHELVKFLFDVDFFVPFPREASSRLDTSLLLSSCTSYEIPTDERADAFIRFSVLDGTVQAAEYFSRGTAYAHAGFKDGLPYVRSVDNTGDGIFETTEYFGFDSDGSFISSETERSRVMANVFALPSADFTLYVRMIQIDRNGDTVPDFTEEYLPHGGKITSWDTDSDGKWDVRYKKYPKNDENSDLVEDSEFYSFLDGQLVTITKINGEPVKVRGGNVEYQVTPGLLDGFYWIGEEGNADDEYHLLSNFDRTLPQGKCVLLEGGRSRMLCVKVGEDVFGQILPPSETEGSSQEEEEIGS